VPRLRVSLLAAALLLSVSGTAGCVDDDEYITCSNFDDFLYECYFNCASSFKCEDNYGLLDTVSQELLLECSECLAEQSLEEDCADCIVAGWSCKTLMVDLLKGECNW
jgi:hypothetical protein